MTEAAIAILSEHRRALPSAPCFRDLVPATALTIADALLTIRKARAALLVQGSKLSSADVTVLAREIRQVCGELDQVRSLLLADSEGL